MQCCNLFVKSSIKDDKLIFERVQVEFEIADYFEEVYVIGDHYLNNEDELGMWNQLKAATEVKLGLLNSIDVKTEMKATKSATAPVPTGSTGEYSSLAKRLIDIHRRTPPRK